MTPKTYSITVRKLIPAPVEKVWATWKNPVAYQAIHAVHKAEIDFRVGGLNKVQFYSGKAIGETFIYQEIMPNRKLIFAWHEFEENPATVLFLPDGEKTELQITQECQENLEWISNCLDGWAWIVDSTEAFFRSGTGLNNDAWRQQYGGYRLQKID